MAKKSGMEIAGNLAHFAKALYDIIKAFMQDGWAAAALQALKHYWPQILCIAVVLLLLPIIVFCCLPMFLFGWNSSTNTEISSMTAQANTVSAYYENYATYIDEGVEAVISSITDSGGQNTETDDTTHETDTTEEVEYEVVYSGAKIQKNWFIALHAVMLDNNLNAATEPDVRSFAEDCFECTVTSTSENTESDTESITTSYIINIHYLSSDEIMTSLGFDDTDKNWATLMHKTLEEGGTTQNGT